MTKRSRAFGRMPAPALFVSCGVACGALSCGSPAADSKSTLPPAPETWCPDGFEPGPQDTCFSLPEEHGKATPVVVYLHGMFEGHGSADEWATIREVTKRGFAVVVPRGKRGLCAWRAELKDHFCWPQEAEDPQTMRSIIAEWERVLWQVDALLEGGAHKRYVLAYSNGGSFGSFIATHGLFPAEAFAIISGGSLGGPGRAKAVPMLLVSAEDDAEQRPKMKDLHEQLAQSGWAHAHCLRSGGHALSADDVDAALQFFKHDADGSLHAQGASYACEGATRPVLASTESPPTKKDAKK